MWRELPNDGQIEIYFETVNSTGAPVAPSSAFTTADFAIYKNGSATAKATTNGLTVTSPFNSETGCHLLVIDTSVDTGDTGWWEVGARYHVKFNTSKTVDSVSIDGRSLPRGSFGIQADGVMTRLGTPAGASVSADIAAVSSSTGTGARTVTITVNDGTTILQNARVRVVEGVNTYTGLTNASGVVVFNLDDATYTVSITKSGYTYAGTSLIVDGTETRTYSMTVVSVTPPDDPALCAVTIHVFDQYGADMSGQPVEITFVKWDTTATDTPPVLSVPPVQTTDSDGLVSVNLFREAVYRIVYGNAPYTRRIDVTIPDAGTYTVEI